MWPSVGFRPDPIKDPVRPADERGERERVDLLKGERERGRLHLYFFFFFFLNPTLLSHVLVLVHVSLDRFVWKIFRGL
jgi:hypothetical protein